MTDTVTIPRAEYDRLRAIAEDVADSAAFDRVVARLARGEEEAVPAAFANRIIDGDSPLRVYREYRGLTQVALAEASGVNRVQIADIEAGRKSGSVGTVRKLAVALNVAVDDLV
ncbi:MAG TPA: helix-turn-helix transcriptional regulator [Pelagibacterium sp.]|uniref:helix-turn-helix transcriptional regulator n=1 Tax=Pelagibacterium sp. TaxID=1967288 RepID=UPI002CF72E29|nr:helix-turn-helix transcriptional regulator [Pelagibacterium sp.]HWJ87564.1 helix-turn-helix transcriptional regulator [Pelagibacterium sp.]